MIGPIGTDADPEASHWQLLRERILVDRRGSLCMKLCPLPASLPGTDRQWQMANGNRQVILKACPSASAIAPGICPA